MPIYKPSDDSYLLSETIKKYFENKNKEIKILDMGSGTGIQAETCRQLGFNNITVTDINSEAIQYLKKAGFSAIESDLFDNINGKFDLIIFNPPYLPEDKREPKSSQQNTTAGKKGYELIIKFLKQATSHLTNNGIILLLFSSLSKPQIILSKAEELGYQFNKLSEKKLFFEKLFIYELF